jgi:hypothetical protein
MSRSSSAGVVDGECPGFTPSDGFFAPIPVFSALSDVAVDGSHDVNDIVSELNAAVQSMVVAPTEEEMFEALSMGSSVDVTNSADCFRVLFHQNSVILREAISQRRDARVVSVSRNSNLSSMTTSGGNSSGSDARKKLRLSPPQVFQCPVCPQVLNEKDFSRHVKDWVEKVGTRVVASGHCPGIQDENHPLLIHFTSGDLKARVRSLSADIRSLVHPGAYDTMRPEGSGRHIDVANRIAALMQP